MNPAKLLKKYDLILIAVIFLYCLFFLYLRFASGSEYLLPDEAEQFLRSESYSWVYPKNPPLYTFLLRTLILIFGKSLYIFASFKYFIVFIFLTSFYFITRFFWDFKNALLVFLSVFIFPIYSNQFNHDWAHNILVSAIAALTYLVYFLLVKHNTSPLYILFGILVGLGFLSKYNFVFLFLGLLFTSLATKRGREILFNFKTLISVLFSSMLLIPHGYYLLRSKLETVNYALDRSIDSSFNFLDSVGDFSLSLLNGTLVFFLICLGFFIFPIGKFESYKNLLSENPIYKMERISIAIFSFLSVLVFIIVFKLNYFEGKWLAPVYFTLIPAIFSLVDLDKFTIRKKTIFMCVSVLMVILVVDIKIATKFNPKSILGKVEMEHKDRKSFFQNIDKKIQEQGFDYEKVFLVYSGSEKDKAHIKYFLPKARVLHIKEYKKNPDAYRHVFFIGS